MNNPYLIRALHFGPMIVRRIAEQVAQDRYDSTTDPERFTLREAVAHLADWQEIDLDRIRISIEHKDGAILTPHDESERAEEKGYVNLDVEAQLDLYEARRKHIIEFLEALTPTDWGRSGYHPEKGHMTVYDAHDTYHIEHLSQFLA